MVLADDNFATLRAAVEGRGRRVTDNLVKALSFVLPTSLGQALIIAIAALAFPLREASRSCQWSSADPLDQPDRRRGARPPLALEAPEPDLMRRPPRDPRTPLPRPTPAREDAGRLGDADGRGARSVRVRAWAAARRRRRRCARAGASADDGRYRRGAAPGALPDHLPVAHSPKQGARALFEPCGVRGHRPGAAPTGPVRDASSRPRRVRLGRARPDRAGRGDGRRAGGPAGNVARGALARPTSTRTGSSV